jgi:tetratricopeptide (TPR) repeat protein
MVLANRSRQLFEVTGNRHGIGCALVARGVVQRSLGRIDHAAADYRTALELIDPELGFMYFWAASINLVVALIEGAAEGRDLEQARRQLWAVEALRRYEEGTVPSLTATWVEARLLTRLGQHASAQAKLERVCAGWRGLDMPFEQTVASLDLANCYFEQSLHGEVVRLAGEMFPLFARFRQLPRAYGALTAFHRAAMTGGLRPATIADARAAVVFARVA